jgi:glycerophosphoryl diester phosphodiesterase
MLIYGHRGSPATSPENTLASFREAIDAGVDGLELDVRASADGIPIVIHDRELDRTTSMTGNVDQVPLGSIRSADAGNGQLVPTFEEVLELVSERVHLDIEVKQSGIESVMLSTLANFPRSRWALSSFDEDILLAFRAHSKSIELIPIVSFLSPGLIPFVRKLQSPAVALMASSYTASSAEFFAQEQVPVIVWTVNGLEEAHRVHDLGASGLCTDYPGELIGALRL